MHSRILGTIGALAAALLLALGLNPYAARAASTVDVTYDLSDTDLAWDFFASKLIVSNDDDLEFPAATEVQVEGIISGAMKVRYASDSSSGMPVLAGSATLLTFNLTVEGLSMYATGGVPFPYLTGTLHWQLTASDVGSFDGSALNGITAKLLMTGRAKCGIPNFTYCQKFVGLPSVTVYPSYSRSGAINVSGYPGTAGGALSTRHTLSGRAPAVGWQPGAGYIGLGTDKRAGDDYGGAYITGREILREADGHETKVIPEPGTLLLLGSGAAGLGLLGHSRRRARRG